MSGETGSSTSGWTVDTLYVFLQRQHDDMRDTFDARVREMQNQLERRFEGERRAVELAFDAHRALTNVSAESTDRAVSAALAAQKEAVQVAQNVAQDASRVLARNAELRAAQQNEWRDALDDTLARAMPREEAKAAIDRATERIQEMTAALHRAPTREEMSSALARVSALEKRQAEMSALTAGAQSGRAGIYAAIGSAVALITALIAISVFLSR